MEDRQIPQSQLTPSSDLDFMDIDQALVVPDTPERVSKQRKNVCNGIFMSAASNSRNYGLGGRGLLSRTGPAFVGGVQSAGEYSHSFCSSADISQRQGVSNCISSWRRNDGICTSAFDKDNGNSLSMPSQSVRLPSAPSRRRLVRNGCISPHNIAKAKQLAESSVDVSADVEGNPFSGGSNHVIDVNEFIAKDNAASQAKGKGVLIPTFSSNGHEDRRGAVGCFSGQWDKGKFKETHSIFGQNSNSSTTVLDKCSSSFASAAPETVLLLNEDQVLTPSTTIKKQKKHDFALSSPGKTTEVICLSSRGESSAKTSTLDHGGCPQRVVGSAIAANESSSEVGESDSQSEARAIQVQLDEMLARELQEQFYNEMPEAATGELARGHASSRGSHHGYESRAVPASNTQMQSQSGSFLSCLSRRGSQTWFPSSSMARMRNRILHRSSPMSSEEREMLFPSHMDLDMRMELLEALEAVFDDDTSRFNQLLDSDREFDENDYELLLALDENNHEHLGASAAQIANLPESTVHNDTFEACSICLETPVIGDTIRHLPCLHKFHKDCIDPWLGRKRCCPVCKSDI